MSNSRTYVVGGAFVLAMFCVVLCGSEALIGQSQPSSPNDDEPPKAEAKPTYHYVGVEQTIARIDKATGRIELLSQRNLSRSSLLVEHSKPWEWREIKVRPKPRDRADAPMTEISGSHSP